MDLERPPCTCEPYQPNNPDCAAHGKCSCDGKDEARWGDCPLHVRCDEGCKALVYPQTTSEVKAAYLHWRKHKNMCGCSHGH
jgi:hypothetical protein